MAVVADISHDAKEIYDSIAEQYVEVKKAPHRTAVEQYTLFDLMLLKNEPELGKGARILDMACGYGHYTRKLRDLFLEASYICGLDISSSMIGIAKQYESQLQQNIDYINADGKDLPINEPLYDIVTAVYYLNYAQTRDELRIMIKGIFDQLKPGGSFYAINENPFSTMEGFNNPMHKKYMFVREYLADTLIDGQPIKYTFYWNPDAPSSCVFYNYYFSPSTYETLFKECGFSSLEWVPVQCNPKVENFSFFDDFVRESHMIGLIAKK
ncbi:unnamed protein product [Adineta steineri]|uniref:Methyltransferase domain-containing protein n=1 Tax=Adineta steineri TaxID=433720 RepID=A0A815E7Z7_9BILA|nr:unnamed protein product [Adineta steineri]CAF3623932.1 unnamed protein product [Adineta steineri]